MPRVDRVRYRSDNQVRLSTILGAVSDPTRRAILDRLSNSDARVTEIASEFPIALNSTSKHIRVLEKAGLVRRRIQGRDHVLSLNAQPLAEISDWIDHYRKFWDERLTALERYLQEKRQSKGKRK